MEFVLSQQILLFLMSMLIRHILKIPSNQRFYMAKQLLARFSLSEFAFIVTLISSFSFHTCTVLIIFGPKAEL